MSDLYNSVLKKLLAAVFEVKEIMILDRNANIIAFESLERRDVESIVMSTSVTYLSAIKLVIKFGLGDIEQFQIKAKEGYLFLFRIDENRLLLLRTTRDIISGLFLLDVSRIIEQLSEIPYSMPQRKVSLERRLEEIEDDFQEKYKIFFSYAKVDSSKFKIKEIGDYIADNHPNVEIMFL